MDGRLGADRQQNLDARQGDGGRRRFCNETNGRTRGEKRKEKRHPVLREERQIGAQGIDNNKHESIELWGNLDVVCGCGGVVGGPRRDGVLVEGGRKEPVHKQRQSDRLGEEDESKTKHKEPRWPLLRRTCFLSFLIDLS